MIIKFTKPKKQIAQFAMLLLVVGFITSCGESSQDEMVRILKQDEVTFHNPANPACPEAQLEDINSHINPGSTTYTPLMAVKADLLLKTGHEAEAVKTYENIVKLLGPVNSKSILPQLAIASVAQKVAQHFHSRRGSLCWERPCHFVP